MSRWGAIDAWLPPTFDRLNAMNRTALAVAIAVLIALVGCSAHVIAQSPLPCERYKADSPQSCAVLPLDAPQTAPPSTDQGPPRAYPLVDMGVLPPATPFKHYATMLQVPAGASPKFAIIGVLPAGLTLDRNLLLSGTPRTADIFAVRLIFHTDGVPGSIVGRWTLVVKGKPRPVVPKPPVRPQPARPRPDNHVQVTPQPHEERVALPQTPLGQIGVYRLTLDDLKALDDGAAAEAQAAKQASDALAAAAVAKQRDAEAKADRQATAKFQTDLVVGMAQRDAEARAFAQATAQFQRELMAAMVRRDDGATAVGQATVQFQSNLIAALTGRPIAMPRTAPGPAASPPPVIPFARVSKATTATKVAAMPPGATVARAQAISAGKAKAAASVNPGESSSGSAARPAPVRLADVLAPLREVEYPNAELLHRSVVDLMPLAPPEQIAAIVGQARKTYAYDAEIADLQWQDVGGWKAVRPLPSWGYRTIYGFMPFWWGQKLKPAPGAKLLPFVPQTIDFSLFDRIGVLGAQLDLVGGRKWKAGLDDFDWEGMSRFARVAKDHGTNLDLVLEASNWRDLPATDDPDQIIPKADAAAMAAANLLKTRMNDPDHYLRLGLLPMWKNHEEVFSGLTVLFTPPTGAESFKAPAFQAFMKRFMPSLIWQMRNADRLLTINVAVSESNLCTQSAKSGPLNCRPDEIALETIDGWSNLASEHLVIDTSGTRQSPSGSILSSLSLFGRAAPEIKFNLLVFIPEPIRESRIRLRATIDQLPTTTTIKGARKAALLRSIIPIIFGPGDGSQPSVDNRTANDLAYYDDVFGGSGFWPVPMNTTPTGKATNQQIINEFFTGRLDVGETIVKDISAFHYYMSNVLRLLGQMLVLVVLTGILIYSLAELSAPARRKVALGTWVLAVIAIILSAWLLFLDPALAILAQGNKPLIVLAVIVTATVGVLVGRPQIHQP